MKITLFLLTAAFCSMLSSGEEVLKAVSKKKTDVSEPSDMCFTRDFKRMFMVSDNGILYETDLTGMIIKKAPFAGSDFEGVYCDSQYIYVTDERLRRIHFYDINTLEHVRQIEVPYHGGMNEGYEAITFNVQKNCFIVITEKDPTWIFELDKNNFTKINEVKLKIADDISSATYYNGSLYLLSDEDSQIFQLNPKTYEVIKSWRIKVNNPEGIAFTQDGALMIASDDDQTILNFLPIAK